MSRSARRPILVDMQEPLHTRLDRLFGVGDVRLTYGIAGPLLAALGLIAVFMIIGEWWLLPAALLVVLFLTVVVLIGIGQMLGESGDDEPKE